MQQQHKKQQKHSNTSGRATNTDKDAQGSSGGQNSSMTSQATTSKPDKFDRLFPQSGLSTGGMALETISFIESSLRSEPKTSKLAEESKLTTLDKDEVDEEDDILQPPLEKPQDDRYIDFKPFLTNHGAQVTRKAQANKDKKWNTGTIDVYKKYADQLEDIEADLDLMQKDVKGPKNAQFTKVDIIGERARYEGDSEKSESAKEKSWKAQDYETQKYNEKVMAMRSRDRELNELNSFLSNSGSEDSARNEELGMQEDQDFDREMQKIQGEKAEDEDY